MPPKTAPGWAVALACYPPFVYSALDAYCTYNSPDNAWGVYFAAAPRWLFVAWGLAILGLSGVYCWATVIFGLRFSNLTNRVRACAGRAARRHGPCVGCGHASHCPHADARARALLPLRRPQGIVTNGPYAFCRHPAYLCKNISWWLIAVPWSGHDGAAMAVKRCARLALINGVYYARARTEEAHLLSDAAYADYYNALQRRWGRPPLPRGTAAAAVAADAADGAGGAAGAGAERLPLMAAGGGDRDV